MHAKNGSFRQCVMEAQAVPRVCSSAGKEIHQQHTIYIYSFIMKTESEKKSYPRLRVAQYKQNVQFIPMLITNLISLVLLGHLQMNEQQLYWIYKPWFNATAFNSLD